MLAAKMAVFAELELVLSISCELRTVFVDWRGLGFRVKGPLMRLTISNRRQHLPFIANFVPVNRERALSRCRQLSFEGGSSVG